VGEKTSSETKTKAKRVIVALSYIGNFGHEPVVGRMAVVCWETIRGARGIQLRLTLSFGEPCSARAVARTTAQANAKLVVRFSKPGLHVDGEYLHAILNATPPTYELKITLIEIDPSRSRQPYGFVLFNLVMPERNPNEQVLWLRLWR
jgi:hypothetical protein